MRRTRTEPSPLPGTDWEGTSPGSRILLEEDDRATAWADETYLTELGYRVRTCVGPSSGRACPLVAGRGCPLAEGADAILYLASLTTEDRRDVLRALRRQLPDAPITVSVPAPSVDRYAELTGACRIVHAPHTRRSLESSAAELMRRARRGCVLDRPSEAASRPVNRVGSGR